MANTNSTESISMVITAAQLIHIDDVLNRCACLAEGVADIVTANDVGPNALYSAKFICRSINEQLLAVTSELMTIRN